MCIPDKYVLTVTYPYRKGRFGTEWDCGSLNDLHMSLIILWEHIDAHIIHNTPGSALFTEEYDLIQPLV
jgi:hypothetical protein